MAADSAIGIGCLLILLLDLVPFKRPIFNSQARVVVIAIESRQARVAPFQCRNLVGDFILFKECGNSVQRYFGLKGER